MALELTKHTIGSLIKENFTLGQALNFYGIKFYQNADQTLEQVCEKHRLNPKQVFKKLEEIDSVSLADEHHLQQLPIEFIVAYLRHAHHIFIKNKLPYIGQLIEDFSDGFPEHQPLLRDLKLVFPIFAEDFIKHIYEEEDTLFSYIEKLLASTRRIRNASELYYLMIKTGLQGFMLDHETHDDEMEGIRLLTNQYTPHNSADVHTMVLFEELKHFEHDLKVHASIENRILFPKAVRLENEVRWRLQEKIKLN